MWIRYLAIVALCPLAVGCQLADRAVHNVYYEAKVDTAECVERCRFEKIARARWEAIQDGEHGRSYSKDYAKGFVDGFVDYMQFGGTGQAPYLPPKQYWGAHFRTPEGHRAIEDWNAGFQHGAAVALQSGCRQWVTLPAGHGPDGPLIGPVAPVDARSMTTIPIRDKRIPPVSRVPITLPETAPMDDPLPLSMPPLKKTLPVPQSILGEPESDDPSAVSGPLIVSPKPDELLVEPAVKTLPPPEFPDDGVPGPNPAVRIINGPKEPAPGPQIITPTGTRPAFGAPVPVVTGWVEMK